MALSLPQSEWRIPWRNPAFHAFLWFCVPAVVVGLVLRIFLCQALPYGYYHDDSPDLLMTARSVINHADYKINTKKVYLVPTLYLMAIYAPGVPALKLIPWGQHAVGLLFIIVTGALVRLWFRYWKVWIIPCTLLVAVHPALLWYEHTLMAESHVVFFMGLSALAGTWFALEAAKADSPRLLPAFLSLSASLYLLAGCRPEGKLFFAAGIFLTILHAKAFRPRWALPSAMAATALICHFFTKTGQAGLLLLVATLHMAPDNVSAAPGLIPMLATARADLRERVSRPEPVFARAADRRAVAQAVMAYLRQHPGYADPDSKRELNAFCGKVAKEILLRSILQTPAYAFSKFRVTASEPSNFDFSEDTLIRRQLGAFPGIKDLEGIDKDLFGQPMPDMDAIERFIREHHNPARLAWFNALHQAFADFLIATRTFKHAVGKNHKNGIPAYHLIALAGMLAALVAPGRTRLFHRAWVPVFLGILFVVVLTASAKPRFRTGFDPTIWLYAALACDLAARGAAPVFRRPTGRAKPVA